MENLSERQVVSLLEYCAACASYSWASEKGLSSVDSLRDAVSSTQEVCVRVRGLSFGVLHSFLDAYLDAFQDAQDAGHSLQWCQEMARCAFLLHLDNGGIAL